MKFKSYDVVFAEHPDYISLAFEITQCPYTCEKCHSPELQTDIGQELSLPRFRKIMEQYAWYVQNIIFLGGDQHKEELISLLKEVKKFDLKATLWTGSNKIDTEVYILLDFLKTGEYNEYNGGLGSPTTNQRYINTKTNENISLHKGNI